MALRLRAIFEPQLNELELMPLFRDIEMPLVEVLADMEWTGIAIDVAWFRSLKQRFQRERERVEREIYAAAGEEFNINSNPQASLDSVRQAPAPHPEEDRDGPSTDASVLQESGRGRARAARAAAGVPGAVQARGDVSRRVADAAAPLGRTGCTPRSTRRSRPRAVSRRAIQTCRTSPCGASSVATFAAASSRVRVGCCLTADYSQIELRLLAHLSAIRPLWRRSRRAATSTGRPRRSSSACPLDDVTPEMRARAKTINFATIYGQGAHALSRQLKIEFAEASVFISTYFERFQGVRAFLDATIEQARERGYVQTIFGRRRYIPELRDRNFNIRAFGERLGAELTDPGIGRGSDQDRDDPDRQPPGGRANSTPACCCRCTTSWYSKPRRGARHPAGRSWPAKWSTRPSSRSPWSSTSASGATGWTRKTKRRNQRPEARRQRLRTADSDAALICCV